MITYDALIILGRSLNPDSSIASEDEARLKRAAELYQEGTAKVLIVCGAHGYKEDVQPELTEAEAYARYLEHLGVPRSAIYLEDASQESLGNILFAKTRFLMTHNWRTLLVLPTVNHSTERVDYILEKVLGEEYHWEVLRIGENTDRANSEREAKSLRLTKEINDPFKNGDHDTISAKLMETHPAYGGTKWTIDQLKEALSHEGRDGTIQS